MAKEKKTKKVLEQSIMGGIAVPIGIVLVGALIIFGVTKMLSTDRTYKDLVREMHSKTFGNRWIAAYELSKIISRSQIPDDDIPWLINNLSDIYDSSIEERTRDFVVVALGALRNKETVKFFKKSIKDKDKNVVFHTLVALGSLPQGIDFDWSLVESFLDSEDLGAKQAAIFVLSTHKVNSSVEKIVSLLSDESISIKYSSALALISFKDERGLEVLKEIIKREKEIISPGITGMSQLGVLKVNIVSMLMKNNWFILNDFLKAHISNEKNLKVVAKVRELLEKTN